MIVGGILVHLSLGTLYTFGNLSPYIVSYIRNRSHPADLHSTTSTWIYACALSGQAGSMFVGGWLYAKIGPRWTTLLGSWIMSAGVLLSYFAIKVSFWLLLFTYGIMFGVGVGIGYIGPLSSAMKWMPKWKGVANGFVVAGFGFGALIFDEVQTVYINPQNAQTSSDSDEQYFTTPELLDRVPRIFLILGGTYAFMQLIGSLLLTDPPENYDAQLKRLSTVTENIVEVEDYEGTCLGETITQFEKSSQSVNEGEREGKESRRGISDSKSSPTEQRVDSTSEEFLEETDETSQLITPQEQTDDELNTPRAQPTYKPVFVKISQTPTKENKRNPFESSGSSWTSNVITSLHPKQMLRKVNFYILWFMFLSNGTAVVFIATLYKVFALTFINNDHFLASVGSVAAIFNSLGRIAWGLLADRMSYKFALVVQTATMTVFHLTFYATAVAGKAMFFIWVCVIFFCVGGNFSLFPTAIGRCFGSQYVGVNYGLLFTSQIPAAILVALVSTTLIDMLQWYGLMFFISGCSFVGFLLALCYRSKRYIYLNSRRY